MGGFYVNLHAKSARPDVVERAIAGEADRVWMSPDVNGWISFYGEAVSSQNEESIMSLAEQVSRRSECVVIAFCIHDSDVLMYWLYDHGQLRDRFNSCPDYFGDLEEMFDEPEEAESYRENVRGKSDIVAACCDPKMDVSALTSVLDQNDFSLMAEQRLERLAESLGIPRKHCFLDFQSIGREFSPSDLQLRWLGKDPQPEDSDELADLQRRQAAAAWAIAADVQLQLNHAIASGEFEEVVRLLDQGAKANGLPQDSPATALITALITAVTQARDPNLVKLLLARGADVDRRGAFEKTALSFAMIIPHPEIVQTLIAAGADVNVLDEQDETPLFMAVEGRHPEIVQLLVDAGADPHQPASDGQSPWEFIMETIALHEQTLAKATQSNQREVTTLEEMLGKVRQIQHILEKRP